MNKRERLALLYWSGELSEDQAHVFEQNLDQDKSSKQLLETLESLSTELSAEPLLRPRVDTVSIALERAAKATFFAKSFSRVRSLMIPAATLCTILLLLILSKEISSPPVKITEKVGESLAYVSMQEIDRRFEHANTLLVRTRRSPKSSTQKSRKNATIGYEQRLSHLRSKLAASRPVSSFSRKTRKRPSSNYLRNRTRELRMQMREIKSEMT